MIHVSQNERFNQFFLCYIGIQIIKLGWKIVGKLLHFGCYIYIHDYICIYIYTSSTAQGGGRSFRNRKPIGEVGCCESRMAERSH